MNRIISHADYCEALTNGDSVILKFQTIVPEVENLLDSANGYSFKDVVAQDVTVFISKEKAKGLVKLISEFVV